MEWPALPSLAYLPLTDADWAEDDDQTRLKSTFTSGRPGEVTGQPGGVTSGGGGGGLVCSAEVAAWNDWKRMERVAGAEKRRGAEWMGGDGTESGLMWFPCDESRLAIALIVLQCLKIIDTALLQWEDL